MGRTNLNEDEFDIELLAQKVYTVFKKTLYKLFFPVRVLLMKPMRLMSFIAAGIIVAVIFRYTLKPAYQANFIIKPSNKGDLFFVNLLWDITSLVRNNDLASVAKQLKLDEKTCSEISKIEVELIFKSKTKDSAESASINLLIHNNTLFDTIQSAILKYLETSDYYEKIRKLKTQDIEDLKFKLTKDMIEIDSLKKILAQNMQPRSGGGFVYGEPINPVSVYEEDLNLYKQQMSLKWQTSFISNFELVKGCVPSKIPYSPKLSELLPLCIGLSLLLCFLYNYRKL